MIYLYIQINPNELLPPITPLQERWVRKRHLRRNFRLPLWKAPSNLRHKPQQPHQRNRIRACFFGRYCQKVILTLFRSSGKIFNNGAQHWNHTFYWYCLTPETNTTPGGALGEAIVKKWGSTENFIKTFNENATNNFGSGWTWLVKKGNDIDIHNTSNAGNPLTEGFQPLLTVDIWEHAYYIDYRNARANYLNIFANHVNWKFVESNFNSNVTELKLWS